MTTSANPQSKTVSIVSMSLGIASLLFGWTFLVPIAGVICGFIGLRNEPAGKGSAVTGLVLNGFALLGWIISLIAIVALGGVFFGFSLFG